MLKPIQSLPTVPPNAETTCASCPAACGCDRIPPVVLGIPVCGQGRTCRCQNPTERVTSVVLGAALSAYAVRGRRSTGTVISLLLGTFLIYRGATGHCYLRSLYPGPPK